MSKSEGFPILEYYFDLLSDCDLSYKFERDFAKDCCQKIDLVVSANQIKEFIRIAKGAFKDYKTHDFGNLIKGRKIYLQIKKIKKCEKYMQK